MKAVRQTRMGSTEGNCLAAALASVLDLHLYEVPEMEVKEGWLQKVNEWLADKNLALVLCKYEPNYCPRGLTIGSTKPSEHSEVLHCVVCQNGRIVWDPHPDEIAQYPIVDWMLFQVLDPTQPVWKRTTA
jgi:hypothetical protein